jgi:hypothetical protein
MIAGGVRNEERPEETLARAKANLRRHFAVAGLTERFDESLVLMARQLDWPGPLFYRRANVTSNRPRAEEIDPDIRARFEERNQLDRQLYCYVAQRLDAQIEKAGARFQWDLRLLQARNHGHRYVAKARSLAGRVTRTLRQPS